MWTAINGILIVLALLAAGVSSGDRVTVAAALVVAALAWPVNAFETNPSSHVATIAAFLCVACAFVATIRFVVLSF